MTDLAACFRLSVYLLDAEPVGIEQDHTLTTERLSSFLATAFTRPHADDVAYMAEGDEKVANACAWLKEPADSLPAGAGAVLVEMHPGSIDDGTDATGAPWTMEHHLYRFSCASGNANAEAEVTKTIGPGVP